MISIEKISIFTLNVTPIFHFRIDKIYKFVSILPLFIKMYLFNFLINVSINMKITLYIFYNWIS